jgi:hypothetical protein
LKIGKKRTVDKDSMKIVIAVAVVTRQKQKQKQKQLGAGEDGDAEDAMDAIDRKDGQVEAAVEMDWEYDSHLQAMGGQPGWEQGRVPATPKEK